MHRVTRELVAVVTHHLNECGHHLVVRLVAAHLENRQQGVHLPHGRRRELLHQRRDLRHHVASLLLLLDLHQVLQQVVHQLLHVVQLHDRNHQLQRAAADRRVLLAQAVQNRDAVARHDGVVDLHHLWVKRPIDRVPGGGGRARRNACRCLCFGGTFPECSPPRCGARRSR